MKTFVIRMEYALLGVGDKDGEEGTYSRGCKREGDKGLL